MSKCELCECREYCEWRLDSEKSCDDIKAEFERMKEKAVTAKTTPPIVGKGGNRNEYFDDIL